MHLNLRNIGKFKQQHFQTAIKHRSLSGHEESVTVSLPPSFDWLLRIEHRT